MRFPLMLCAAAVLGACQSTPPPPPEAVTDLSGKTCQADISLVDAIALTPKNQKSWQDVFSQVGPETPCVGEGDAAANYVVFALPDFGPNHVITVGGQKQARRTLAPKILLLDWEGTVTREFAADKYDYRGGSYSVQFRPGADDRFILVETDSALVGEIETRFETQLLMRQGTVGLPNGGTASYTTYSGKEGAQSRTFSHEGVVTVRVQAIKGKIGLPAP